MAAKQAAGRHDGQESSRTPAVQDQVTRHERFIRAHPTVTIEHRKRPHWHWRGAWTDRDGQRREREHFELRGLLDRMEAIFPVRGIR